MPDRGILATEESLEALPVLAIIMDSDVHGAPHAYQKRNIVLNGRWEPRWFCTTDSDWGDTSAQLVREGATYTVLWLPKGSS